MAPVGTPVRSEYNNSSTPTVVASGALGGSRPPLGPGVTPGSRGRFWAIVPSDRAGVDEGESGMGH